MKGIKVINKNEDKIPDDTEFSEEKESWDIKSRIVFSTISGRCGRKLKSKNLIRNYR